MKKLTKRCECRRVDVLCGCGWGRLGLPECEVPPECPVCGFDLWAYGGVPPECTAGACGQAQPELVRETSAWLRQCVDCGLLYCDSLVSARGLPPLCDRCFTVRLARGQW